MPATIVDIARAAGVSHTAVSAVLGGRAARARIGAATAERIIAAAASLGYERNDLAQAVASGSTRLIAIITREPSRTYIGNLLHGALAAAAGRNHLLHLQSVADGAGGDLAAAWAASRAYRPRGVWFCALDLVPAGGLPKPASLLRAGMPVLRSHSLAGLPGTAIDCDDAHDMALAVGHLRDLGHRRIAFLGGPRGQPAADDRRAGFRAAIGGDLPPGCDDGDGWDWESAEPAVRRLLARTPRPTALVCANDCLAVVAMQVAAGLGLAVPRDLSLVGCSDEQIGRYVRPQPTTIVQPHREIGGEAIATIIDLADGRRRLRDLADRRLPGRLAIRGSTAPPQERP